MAYDPNAYRGSAPRANINRQPMQNVRQQFDRRQQQMSRAARMPAPASQQRRSFSALDNRRTNQLGTEGNRVPAYMQANLNRQRRNAMEAARQQAYAQSEMERRDMTRDELYGRARGRIDELRGNELDQAIEAELLNRVQGGGPITDEVRNALYSQQADQAAAIEANQMGMLGGRPGDPAFEAQRSQAALGRQRNLQAANRDLGLQQALQNYAAQGQALSQGAGINRARQSAITDAERNLQDILGSEQFGIALPTQEISLQDYMRMRGGR